jgi:predicted secreted protein
MLTAVRRIVMLMGRRRAVRVVALLTVCGLAWIPTANAAKTCGKLSLGQKSSGRMVTLHRCERVTIRLKEQFDGGYQWKATHRPAAKILKLVSDKTLTSAQPGLVGGSDTRVFVYRAVGKGRTSLTLTESRPFASHSQIAKFTLSVRVK